MKIQYPQLIGVALISTLIGAGAWAQGHVGGGRVQESDLRYFIGMMDPYFQSEEGKEAFPEIVEYDANHAPEDSFHHLMNRIHPVVVDGPVYDDFLDDRDCIANFGDKNNLRFTCNGRVLPEMKLENHPSLYRIVLHELFVAAGIERPINKGIPSDYSVSYRITTHVHLESFDAWVPGKGTGGEKKGIYGIECFLKGSRNEVTLRANRKKADLLMVQSSRNRAESGILPLTVNQLQGYNFPKVNGIDGSFSIPGTDNLKFYFLAHVSDARKEFMMETASARSGEGTRYRLPFSDCRIVKYKDYDFNTAERTATIYEPLQSGTSNSLVRDTLNWLKKISTL